MYTYIHIYIIHPCFLLKPKYAELSLSLDAVLSPGFSDSRRLDLGTSDVAVESLYGFKEL